jgi:hypothetical protein
MTAIIKFLNSALLYFCHSFFGIVGKNEADPCSQRP